MKRLIIILASVLFTAILWSQSPEKMSYQAVIRDADGNLVTSTPVGIEISIRQGSEIGTVVYTETQTPTTNVNGLVSTEIGGGISFDTIDWSAGPYFIETKIDPIGGTNYTITSVSQLLSVPYALHAKKTESISETDPVFSAWDKDYKDLINTPTIDGSETKIIAGTNVNITGEGTTSNPYIINSSRGGFAHYVGELYGGGVVFWVNRTGEHGLIVSMVDVSTMQEWSNIWTTLIGTTNDWNGYANTAAIMQQSGHISSAAQVCTDYINADYGTGVYNDWYLPSAAELQHIGNNFYEVQKALTNHDDPNPTPIQNSVYWSSTETDNSNGTTVYFPTWKIQRRGFTNPKDRRRPVRAIRAF